MKHDRVQRILIIRFSSIGDIILTTPLIRALRTRFPQARLDFVSKREFGELLETNPRLDRFYLYDTQSGVKGLSMLARELRSNRYDLCIDLHKSLRSRHLRFLLRAPRIISYSKQILPRTLLVKTGMNCYNNPLPIPERYLRQLAPFGVEPDGKGPELFPTEQQYATVLKIFKKEHVTPQESLFGFGPIAAHPLKQWPLQKFAQLGQRLVRRHQARILIFGGPSDRQQGEELARQIPNNPVVLCGKLSLLESAAALKSCAVFIGNDSGSVHMASAMSTPVVVIFGPTVKELGFYPYRVRSQVVSTPLPCRPCTHTGKGRCKIEEQHACMERIGVEQVAQAATELLRENS